MGVNEASRAFGVPNSTISRQRTCEKTNHTTGARLQMKSVGRGRPPALGANVEAAMVAQAADWHSRGFSLFPRRSCL